MRQEGLDMKITNNEDNGQVFENRVHWYTEELLTKCNTR